MPAPRRLLPYAAVALLFVASSVRPAVGASRLFMDDRLSRRSIAGPVRVRVKQPVHQRDRSRSSQDAYAGLNLNSLAQYRADHDNASDRFDRHTDEQRLLYHLLGDYEKATRPVRNASGIVSVKLGMTLTNIFDMDEKNQVMTINVWLDQEWKDELLRWEPSKFGGIKSLRIPCDMIWLPDIVLYNSAEDYTHGYMRSRAMVFYDGTVFWPPPTRLRSTCKISVTYFPFDSQHCSLKFGSWTYHGYQVDITNRSMGVDLSNYVESGEFDLVNVYQKRRVVKYTCCEEPYPDLTFYIHIRRKTLYYLYNIVFPCIMMTILTLLVFFLPPDSGEKIALGVTVLLAFSVFVLAIAEKMPETSDSIPLIGIYLTVVMGMTSISVVMTVMVLNFHHRGPFNKPVPRWLHDLVLVRVRNAMRMRMPYSGFASAVAPGIASMLDNGLLHGMLSPARLPAGSIASATMPKYDGQQRSTAANGSANQSEYQALNGTPLGDQDGSARNVGYRDARHSSGTAAYSALTDVDEDATGGSKRRRRRRPSYDALRDKLLRTLENLTSRQENDDRLQLMANEWRQIAEVIDRLMFCVFLFATVVITVVLLLIVPIWHRHSDSSTVFDESLYGLH